MGVPRNIVAAADVLPRRVIELTAFYTGDEAGALTELAVGVSSEGQRDALDSSGFAAATGDPIPLQDVTIDGTVRVEAGGAIATLDWVATDASGRVVDATTGQDSIGIALEAAAAAGDVISVLWRPNTVAP